MSDTTELKTERRPRVLVTGQAGMVGRVVAPTLDRQGFDVIGLDLSEGADLLNPVTVRDRL